MKITNVTHAQTFFRGHKKFGSMLKQHLLIDGDSTLVKSRWNNVDWSTLKPLWLKWNVDTTSVLRFRRRDLFSTKIQRSCACWEHVSQLEGRFIFPNHYKMFFGKQHNNLPLLVIHIFTDIIAHISVKGFECIKWVYESFAWTTQRRLNSPYIASARNLFATIG